MKIIPVIDVKDGCAVLACQGDRKNYQPLSTALCSSCQIDDVVDAYLSVFSFSKIYIADLDALMETGNNDRLINSLATRFPEIEFIIDCGSVNPQFNTGQFTTIVGTESVDALALLDLKKKTDNFILSLDFSRQHTRMGESILYESPELWPKELIIMTLGLVGKNIGPDLSKLQYYSYTYPEYNFIAAGGIRNLSDLIKLQEIGIQQTLVASALHNKKLTHLDIQELIT